MSDFDATEWARGGLRFLLLKHPMRTSLGMCGGATVSMLLDAFKQMIPAVVNVAAFSDVRMAIAGAFVVNARQLLKPARMPEHIEDMFEAVRVSVKEGNLSQAQTRMLYINVCNRAASRSSIGTHDGESGTMGGRRARD